MASKSIFSVFYPVSAFVIKLLVATMVWGTVQATKAAVVHSLNIPGKDDSLWHIRLAHTLSSVLGGTKFPRAESSLSHWIPMGVYHNTLEINQVPHAVTRKHKNSLASGHTSKEVKDIGWQLWRVSITPFFAWSKRALHELGAHDQVQHFVVKMASGQ